jgi:hypothetical protein
MTGTNEERAPASYVQRAMWMAAQRNRSAPLNVMILAWRIRGPLRRWALESAAQDVIARHAAMRTRLESKAGQLLQVIGASEFVPLVPVPVDGATTEARLQSAIAMLKEEGRQPLDLGLRPPIRIRLLRVDDGDHVFCMFVHHAMCDGWSSQVIMKDLADCYCARVRGRTAQLPELKETYADFAQRQIRTYESGGYSAEIAYWRSELDELPPPVQLPAIAPRKANRDWRAASPTHIEPLQLLAALKDFARRRRVSLFSVLLAGIAALVRDATGARDLILGVSTVNRWSKEAMLVVGCYTNMLPVRIRVTDDAGFDEFVGTIHGTVRRLLAYGRIPLELILRELNGTFGGGNILPLWCQLRELPPTTVLEGVQLSLTPLLVDRAAIFGELEADLIESDRGLECVFAHRAALFEASTVNAMLSDYGAILRSLVAQPPSRVSDLYDRTGVV